MLAKSLIAAAAVASSLALAAPMPAAAKTTIDINIGVGGYYPGYYGGYYGVGYGPGYISCKKGRHIVDWSGFNAVSPIDCALPGYRYTAWKNGHKYVVRVNGYGAITNVHKLF